MSPSPVGMVVVSPGCIVRLIVDSTVQYVDRLGYVGILAVGISLVKVTGVESN